MGKCRCYINAKYKSKTAWSTGRLPKPCPIHEPEEFREWEKTHPAPTDGVSNKTLEANSKAAPFEAGAELEQESN